MDGGDGSWAVMPSAPGNTSAQFEADEDQIGDNERNHTTEQVAYVAFAEPGSIGGDGLAVFNTFGVAEAGVGHIVEFSRESLSLERVIDREATVKVDAGQRSLTLLGNRDLTVGLGTGVDLAAMPLLELLADLPEASRLTLAFEGAGRVLGSIELVGRGEGFVHHTLDLARMGVLGDAERIVITNHGSGGVSLADVALVSRDEVRSLGVLSSMTQADPEPEAPYSITTPRTAKELIEEALETGNLSEFSEALDRSAK